MIPPLETISREQLQDGVVLLGGMVLIATVITGAGFLVVGALRLLRR